MGFKWNAIGWTWTLHGELKTETKTVFRARWWKPVRKHSLWEHIAYQIRLDKGATSRLGTLSIKSVTLPLLGVCIFIFVAVTLGLPRENALFSEGPLSLSSTVGTQTFVLQSVSLRFCGDCILLCVRGGKRGGWGVGVGVGIWRLVLLKNKYGFPGLLVAVMNFYYCR